MLHSLKRARPSKLKNFVRSHYPEDRRGIKIFRRV